MKKILLILVVICTLLFAFTACDDVDDAYVAWELSDDGAVLKGDGVEYHRYCEMPIDFEIRSPICYENDIARDGDLISVYAPSVESGIRYTYSYRTGYVAYVKSDSEKATIDKLISGVPGGIRLVNYNTYLASDLEDTFVAKLDALTAAPAEVEVRKLYSAERYDVIYYDGEDAMYYTHGAIYLYEDNYYYVNYELLDNSYFTSFGEFSYRRGTVVMQKLDADTLTLLSSALDNAYSYEDMVYGEWELDGEDEGFTYTEAAILLTVTVLLLAVILPGVPFTISLIAILKGKRNPINLTILVAAAVWIVCGIICLIIAL